MNKNENFLSKNVVNDVNNPEKVGDRETKTEIQEVDRKIQEAKVENRKIEVVELGEVTIDKEVVDDNNQVEKRIREVKVEN